MERRRLTLVDSIPNPSRTIPLYKRVVCFLKGHQTVRGAMRQPFCGRCLSNLVEERSA